MDTIWSTNILTERTNQMKKPEDMTNEEARAEVAKGKMLSSEQVTMGILKTYATADIENDKMARLLMGALQSHVVCNARLEDAEDEIKALKKQLQTYKKYDFMKKQINEQEDTLQ
jgi:hypothetical protein